MYILLQTKKSVKTTIQLSDVLHKNTKCQVNALHIYLIRNIYSKTKNRSVAYYTSCAKVCFLQRHVRYFDKCTFMYTFANVQPFHN